MDNNKKETNEIRQSVPQENFKKMSVVLNILENNLKFSLSKQSLTYLLYILDTMYYERFEKQFMGMCYIKYNQSIFIRHFHRESVTDEEKETILSSQEKEFLNRIIRNLNEEFRMKGKKDIEDYLKDYVETDIPFESTKNHQPIDYELVFYRDKDHTARPENFEDDQEYSREFLEDLAKRAKDAVEHPENLIPAEKVWEEINNNKKQSELEKKVAYYMSLPYAYKFIKEEDGTWFVQVDELLGCMSMGDTLEEAMSSIKEAQELWIETAIDEGLDIPLPEVMRDNERKVSVYLPKEVYFAISKETNKVSDKIKDIVIEYYENIHKDRQKTNVKNKKR